MTDRESDPDSDAGRGRGTLADVRHTRPETAESFGAVYRRGPAMTDGGSARADGRGSPSADAGSGSGTAGSAERTLADVDHEPPYPEPAGVWSRGPAPDAGGDA